MRASLGVLVRSDKVALDPECNRRPAGCYGLVALHRPVSAVPHHLSPIEPGAAFCNLHPPPSLQGCEQHEKVAHPVAFVFIIIRARRSGAGWTAQPGLLHLLSLVSAHQDLVGYWLVDLQHPPWRTRIRHCLGVGCTSTLSARGVRFFQRLAHRFGAELSRIHAAQHAGSSRPGPPAVGSRSIR